MELVIFTAVFFFGLCCLTFSIRIYLNTIAIQRQLRTISQHLGIDFSNSGELSDRVKELARDPAQKIQAIKAYREESGAGLADAKDAIEAYIRSQNP